MRTVCAVLALDSALDQQTAVLRRNLLKLVHVREFASASEFKARAPCLTKLASHQSSQRQYTSCLVEVASLCQPLLQFVVMDAAAAPAVKCLICVQRMVKRCCLQCHCFCMADAAKDSSCFLFGVVQEPCMSYVLRDVICPSCNDCRDLDLCRDPHLQVCLRRFLSHNVFECVQCSLSAHVLAHLLCLSCLLLSRGQSLTSRLKSLFMCWNPIQQFLGFWHHLLACLCCLDARCLFLQSA